MSDTQTLRKAKFLTAVWGRAYIERFAAVSLPSFLAPGNLPALADMTDLEVVIMTCRDDIPYFETQVAFQRLREACPVRFVEIDDLVTNGIYGVTLTLAYARPIIECGADMVNTHFVFMNADFVLADGSLRALGAHIQADRAIVLGPSFRATAEQVEPLLEDAVDTEAGVLAMGTRDMTRLSLPHAHPTTLAKIVNQDFCHSVQPNQFFWRVDENTLLGRYFLIFMLCLRPERVFEHVNAYCDYCLVPELCPSGDEVAMGDSDDFFMLELQARDQERELLRIGELPFRTITSNLGEWATKEHRRAATHDIVFHAEDLPDGLDARRAEAEAWVNRIEKALPAPVDHVDHHYWVGGLAAWRLRRELQGLPSTAPEVDRPRDTSVVPTHDEAAQAASRKVAFRARVRAMAVEAATRTERFIAALVGRKPRVTAVHPTWLEYRHFRQALAAAMREGDPGDLVVVGRHPIAFRTLLDGPDAPRFMIFEALAAMEPDALDARRIFAYVERRDMVRVRALLARWEADSGPLAECRLFFHQSITDLRRTRHLTQELVFQAHGLLRWRLGEMRCEFGGGEVRGQLHRATAVVATGFARSGVVGRVFIAPALVATLVAGFLGNLALAGTYLSKSFRPRCTTALVTLAFDRSKAGTPGGDGA